MSDLVVIAFADEEKAEDVRKKILGLTQQYLIEIEDAVVAVKLENGHIKLNQLVNPMAMSAVSGTMWGAIIGLIFANPLLGAALGGAAGAVGGALTDLGINDDFMRQTAEAVGVGQAALFLLIRKMTTDKVLDDLRGVGGTVLRTSFDHEHEDALRAALAGNFS
ncbi:MAG: DUF1269 domain-containing protein [Acetobacteraceae bacterium]|nr:DUF1269 domain-containing protein [Acetobacteraceae bacterium]